MVYYFDMDGTIANLYGVNGWLDNIINEDIRPYVIAKPLCDMEKLYNAIQSRIANGDRFGIVSWTAKGGSKEYNANVRKAKIEWIKKYLPNCFTEIHIVKYGTPKYRVVNHEGILFDDEIGNRNAWKWNAYTEKEIFEVLEG